MYHSILVNNTPKHICKRKWLAVLIVNGLVFPALANKSLSQPNNTSVSNVETIVVTASGFEQQIRDASANISIITATELQKQKTTNLADSVKPIEGIAIIGSDINNCH